MLSLALVLIAGCHHDHHGEATFAGYEPVAEAWGIHAVDARGVCVVDVDDDGDLDLLATGAGGVQLWLNLEPGVFVEDGAARGLPGAAQWLGCGAADLDGDGDEDLLLTDHDGPTVLLLNDGAGSFIDGTAAAGLGEAREQGSVIVTDLDLDGLPDLVLTGVARGETRVYEGVGAGRFEDRTELLGLSDVERSWAGAAFDANNDKLPDLFLATDVPQPAGENTDDRFLMNKGAFSLFNVTVDAELSDASDGMGVAVADFDQDSFLDFFVTNIGPHFLWRNLSGVFLNAATAASIDNGGGRVGWGTFFFDPDEDGDLDLFIANGGYYRRGDTGPLHDGPTPRDRLFLQEGRRGRELPRFRDAASILGLDDADQGMGATFGDLDGDGRIDLVVANQGGAALAVHRSLGHIEADPGALRLRLRGTTSLREALGAHVIADVCGETLLRTVGTGPSVFSQGERDVHLALRGCDDEVVLVADWPSGRVESFVVPVGDRGTVVELVEGTGEVD